MPRTTVHEYIIRQYKEPTGRDGQGVAMSTRSSSGGAVIRPLVVSYHDSDFAKLPGAEHTNELQLFQIINNTVHIKVTIRRLSEYL